VARPCHAPLKLGLALVMLLGVLLSVGRASDVSRTSPVKAGAEAAAGRVAAFDDTRPVRRATIGAGSVSVRLSSPMTAGELSRRRHETVAGTGPLLYGNTQGNRTYSLGASVRQSDDLLTVGSDGCGLDRYEVLVDGNHGGAGSGPFSVQVALYDGCPRDDGDRIDGTEATVALPDNGVYLIEVVMPEDVTVTIPAALWVGVTFSRSGAGWVMGAPALVGHSRNAFEHSFFGCGIWLGDYPLAPHSSFYVQLFGRGACPSTHAAFRSEEPPVLSAPIGAGSRVADDLELGGGPCDLVSYELFVRGTAAFDYDLRRHDAQTGLPGAVIPKTSGTIEAFGNRLRVARHRFAPPVPLPDKIWITVESTTGNGQPLLSLEPPSIGNTTPNSITRFVDDQWQLEELAPGEKNAAISVLVRCAGDEPLGACCDTFFLDADGNAVCRQVAEANCPLLRWIEGAACHPDPFVPRCGASACCLADGSCENRVQSDCGLGAVSWTSGIECRDLEPPCAFVCPRSDGPCGLPHDAAGCFDPACCARVCAEDAFCCNEFWDSACAGRTRLSCDGVPGNDECAPGPDSLGAYLLEVGDTLEVDTVRATSDALDPGFCCHTGFPASCDGGCHDLEPCADDLDCVGAEPGICGEDGRCDGGCRDTEACDDDEGCFGTDDGFCRFQTPLPGQAGVGTIWFRFAVPEVPGDDTANVRITTCNSNAPASDSLLQAFAVTDPTLGRCDDLGRCADGSPCSFTDQDCADGQACVRSREACDVVAQDCPGGAACVLDEQRACQALEPIECNDDAPDTCLAIGQQNNAAVCLSGIRRGRPYYLMLAAKSEDTRGAYRLRIEEVDACAVLDVPPNDSCDQAALLTDGVYPFDLSTATADCDVEPCLPAPDNDAWFQYRAMTDGLVTFDTCPIAAGIESDTSLVVYDGCTCSGHEEGLPPVRCCSVDAGGDCGPGARCQVEVRAGDCYLVRLGDGMGLAPAGTLRVTSRGGPLCPSGAVTWLDPPPGAVDARTPHPPDNAQVRRGIDRVIVRAPNACQHACWNICTPLNEGGPTIDRVTCAFDGTATLELSRPLLPGSTTLVGYRASPEVTAAFSALPGDVDGDGVTSPVDLLNLVDVLNGTTPPRWGAISTDLDHSGDAGPTDILELVDLLNGAAAFDAWNGRALPDVPPNCP